MMDIEFTMNNGESIFINNISTSVNEVLESLKHSIIHFPDHKIAITTQNINCIKYKEK